MPTTNSRKATTYEGKQCLVFERDSKISYLGKERDDTSATISFTPVFGDGIEVSFNYVSFQAEKTFGRELSLDLAQVIELKRFLDDHIDRAVLKKEYTFIFLFGEHVSDDFASKYFTDYEFVCQARISGRKLTKYSDKDYSEIVGLSYSKDNWVFGNIYRITTYDKQNLDSTLKIGHLLLNEGYYNPRKINSDEHVKYNNESISVTYYKLNDINSYFRSNHRDLLPEEKQLFVDFYKNNGFSEPYVVELMGKV